MLASTPGAHPRWFALSPDRTRAATVSEETDELLVVSEREPLRRIAVGDGPTDVTFINDREVAVAHRDDAAIWIVRIAGPAAPASRIAVGARQDKVALAPGGHLLAVARAGGAPELALIDLGSSRVSAQNLAAGRGGLDRVRHGRQHAVGRDAFRRHLARFQV